MAKSPKNFRKNEGSKLQIVGKTDKIAEKHVGKTDKSIYFCIGKTDKNA